MKLEINKKNLTIKNYEDDKHNLVKKKKEIEEKQISTKR